MDTAEVIDLIDKQVAAYNARDLEGFFDCYANDARIIDGAGSAMAEGHAGMRQMYAPLFENSPNLHAEIANRIQIGTWVIDDELTSGFVLPGYPTDLRAVVVYHVVDGKIAQSQILG
jgi:uncharacterized protein (TIGR02246 family)